MRYSPHRSSWQEIFQPVLPAAPERVGFLAEELLEPGLGLDQGGELPDLSVPDAAAGGEAGQTPQTVNGLPGLPFWVRPSRWPLYHSPCLNCRTFFSLRVFGSAKVGRARGSTSSSQDPTVHPTKGRVDGGRRAVPSAGKSYPQSQGEISPKNDLYLTHCFFHTIFNGFHSHFSKDFFRLVS